MENLKDLMIELDGADVEKVNQIAWEKGSLPVRLAMLGLSSVRKEGSPLWWGYPPGVFISYKWDGLYMQRIVSKLANYIRSLGYNAFLDIENLDENADAYFQIPQFITSVQVCSFYILLLTELSSEMIFAGKNKTTWIHDEYQHAVRLSNSGRLVIIPVLLETNGLTDFYRIDNVIDLRNNQYDFRALNAILTPDPVKLVCDEIEQLKDTVNKFDTTFLNQGWNDSEKILKNNHYLGNTFDYQFRVMLHALYTANQNDFYTAYDLLKKTYGEKIVSYIYSGYCQKHKIPNRITTK